MAIYGSAAGWKGRTFELRVLNRWVFYFFVLSTHCEGQEPLYAEKLASFYNTHVRLSLLQLPTVMRSSPFRGTIRLKTNFTHVEDDALWIWESRCCYDRQRVSWRRVESFSVTHLQSADSFFPAWCPMCTSGMYVLEIVDYPCRSKANELVRLNFISTWARLI